MGGSCSYMCKSQLFNSRKLGHLPANGSGHSYEYVTSTLLDELLCIKSWSVQNGSVVANVIDGVQGGEHGVCVWTARVNSPETI